MRKWAALSIIFISGCSYTKPFAIAPMQLGPKEKPIGIVTGTSSATYLLGFRIEGEDSLNAAVKDARMQAKVPKSTMANVFVDRYIFYFPAIWLPIYMESKTTIFGTLIAYEEPPK